MAGSTTSYVGGQAGVGRQEPGPFGTYFFGRTGLVCRDDLSGLSPTEYRLLRYLMLNPGRVLTRAQLLDHVWDYDFGGSSTVVATYVAYLRRKLARYGPDVIHTQRAVGYSLRLPRG